MVSGWNARLVTEEDHSRVDLPGDRIEAEPQGDAEAALGERRCESSAGARRRIGPAATARPGRPPPPEAAPATAAASMA